MPADDDDTPTTDSDVPLTAVDVQPITATDIHVLPSMNGEIDILSTVPGGLAGKAAARVRDDALLEIDETKEHDLLRAPPRNIDINATIVTKRASDAAEDVRDQALDIKRDFDAAKTLRREPSDEMKARQVDVNATIVSKRAASQAEIERDLAFEEIKRRKGDTNAPPLLDAGDEALIAQLKALPSEGVEPNWRLMEDAIADEIGAQPIPMPWWRNRALVVPLGLCAAAAIVTLVLVKTSATRSERTATLTRRDAGVEQRIEASEPTPGAKTTTLWLDGEPFELDEISDDALQQITPGLDEAPADMETDTVGDDEAGILPTSDYGWIDTLDDAEAERAEAWLTRAKS